jgi:hypothetical protein
LLVDFVDDEVSIGVCGLLPSHKDFMLCRLLGFMLLYKSSDIIHYLGVSPNNLSGCCDVMTLGDITVWKLNGKGSPELA